MTFIAGTGQGLGTGEARQVHDFQVAARRIGRLPDQALHGWLSAGQRRPAVDSFAWAAAVDPENAYYVNTLKIEYNNWQAEVCSSQAGRISDLQPRRAQAPLPDGSAA